jgi:predicted DNA-binding transcriptional regulator AlpA
MKKAKPEPIGPVLRRPGARAFVGLGNTQFDQYVEAGDLPAPIRITDNGRSVAWLRSELEQWLAARIAKRDAELAKKRRVA